MHGLLLIVPRVSHQEPSELVHGVVRVSEAGVLESSDLGQSGGREAVPHVSGQVQLPGAEVGHAGNGPRGFPAH